MSNEIRDSYNKIIITIVPSYTAHLFAAIDTCNDTNNNKLVIYFSIALYYRDTYIVYSTIALFSGQSEQKEKQFFHSGTWLLYTDTSY